jgi:hypothetical protein
MIIPERKFSFSVTDFTCSHNSRRSHKFPRICFGVRLLDPRRSYDQRGYYSSLNSPSHAISLHCHVVLTVTRDILRSLIHYSAKFLTEEERDEVERRLKHDRSSLADEFDLKYAKDALKDWKIYVHMLITIGIYTPLYSISLFLPTLVPSHPSLSGVQKSNMS